MKTYVSRLMVCLFVFVNVNSFGAILTTSGGQLTGATQVEVGGDFYDVTFYKQRCTSLAVFNGCDEPGDFTFSDEATALLAGQALLDQVLIGVYDEDPNLTEGCFQNEVLFNRLCFLYTPYDYDPSGAWSSSPIRAAVVKNLPTINPGEDAVTASGFSPTRDFRNTTNTVLVYWTASAVPIPTTAWLFGSALLGLYGLRRR